MQTITERIVNLTTNSLDPQGFAQQVNDYHFKIKDYVADPRDVRLYTDKEGSLLSMKGVGTQGDSEFDETQFPLTELAHSQLADFTGVPYAYYKRMQAEQHALLDSNVNTWLDYLSGRRRMIRTLDGRVRAVLSNRYRRIDNYDVANTVLPVLISQGARFRRLHVTEDEMLIQAVFTEKTADIKVGDPIMLGVTIKNNEVGKGMVEVQPMSLRLFCLNGATHNELGEKRMHVGTKLGGDGDPSEIFKDDTLLAADKALMLQLRDVVEKAASETVLHSIAADFQRAEKVPITTQPVFAVTELSNRHGLTESDNAGILQHLLAGGDMNQFGMANAITRYAQDIEDGLRAGEFEELGGNILSLSVQEFGPIASAGAPKERRRRK